MKSASTFEAALTRRAVGNQTGSWVLPRLDRFVPRILETASDIIGHVALLRDFRSPELIMLDCATRGWRGIFAV